jgi:hypothetical protein
VSEEVDLFGVTPTTGCRFQKSGIGIKLGYLIKVKVSLRKAAEEVRERLSWRLFAIQRCVRSRRNCCASCRHGHWIFALSAVPGVVIAALIALLLREHSVDELSQDLNVVAHGDKPRWINLFRSRNVVLAMLAALCAMAGIFVISAMVPNYLIDHLHLDPVDGLFDAGVSYVSNESGHSNLKFDDGIAVPNLLGFKGTEDLGGSLSAVFNLVDQFSFDTGQIIQSPGALFGRTAYVGLSHDDWGSLTLGNQYDFMTDSLFFGRDDAAGYIGGLYNFRAGPFSKLALPHCVSAS